MVYLATIEFVGIEVLTAVVMKRSVFWDIISCSPLKVNRCFGGTCRLNLRHDTGSRQDYAGFVRSLFFDPEDGGGMFLRNVSWLSTD
jgi:hypothetical protein